MEYCGLCSENYNFNDIRIGEVLGQVSFMPVEDSKYWIKIRKFAYCPECGRKLTEKDFEGEDGK